MLDLFVQRSRRGWFATTLLLAVGVSACGASQESTSTESTGERVSPVVSSISLGDQVDANELARGAWSEIADDWQGPFTTDPFSSDGTLYALAYGPDLGGVHEDGTFVLLKWEDAWIEADTLRSPGCYSGIECRFEIVASSTTARPVIGIYWCCPIGGYRGDEMVSVYMVVEDRVVGLLPEGSNQFWPVSISGESFTIDDCVEGVDADPDRDGYDDYFCYQSRFTTYTINGARAVESEVELIDIPGQPFDACIWSVGEECGHRTVVEDTESCVFSALVEVYRFPIDSCQYGYWVLEFEEALFDDGFTVNPDGFYLPSEMAVVSRAQLLAGLESDGLIGPATWSRFVEYAQCSETFGVGGMPNDIISCEYDMNGDGLYGPGDIVPD